MSHRLGALLILGLACVSSSDAAELTLPRDGWATWRVATVADAPNWCCFGPGANTSLRSCELDGRNGGFGSRSEDAPTEYLQVYAKFGAGQLERLRSYGSSCAVHASVDIRDLGEIDSAASARWLATQASPRNARSGDVLAALAAHAGNGAELELIRVAGKDLARESRKDALFWLGQLRGESGARAIEPFLLGDSDAAVREHAGFALSQSKSTRRGELLILQAQRDSSKQVRAQAWFWLAQIGDPGAEQAIRSALQTEPSDHVREQAVFALSQLPDRRGVNALISLLEDHSVALAQRKQALFWLGQAEDDAAQQYLAQVLGG